MNELKSITVIVAIKLFSCLGMIAAAIWFVVRPDFAAVLAGILFLTAFMMTFLPMATDQQV